MRRALVLSDETARHPFRASLPLQRREVRDELTEPRVPWRVVFRQDVQGFLPAYVACLVAAIAFII